MKELKIVREKEDCFLCAFDAKGLCKMIDDDLKELADQGVSLQEAAVRLAEQMNSQRQLLFLGYVIALNEFGLNDTSVAKTYEVLAEPAPGKPMAFPIYKHDRLIKALLGDANENEVKGRLLKAVEIVEQGGDKNIAKLIATVAEYARTPQELALMVWITCDAKHASENPFISFINHLKGG